MDINKENIKETIYETIISDPQMIQHVQQTPDICMLALIKDHTCYKYIKDPTFPMQQFIKDRMEMENYLGKKILMTF